MTHVTERTASKRCAHSLHAIERRLIELAGKWGGDFRYIETAVEEAAHAVLRAAATLEEAAEEL